MDEEVKLSKRIFPLKMTEDERAAVKHLGITEGGGSESNAVRRAIKMFMENKGLDTTGLFEDRKEGNRTVHPKNAALATR